MTSPAARAPRVTGRVGEETDQVRRADKEVIARNAAPPGRRAAGTRRCARTAAEPDGAAPLPEPGQPDVWDWVRRTQEGDAEAFGQLYDHYASLVYRYVNKRVGDRATTEDVTSETFVRVLHRIDSLSFQGRDVGAWPVTIARTIVLDHVKSSRYRLEVSTADMRDADRATAGPEDAGRRSDHAAERGARRGAHSRGRRRRRVPQPARGGHHARRRPARGARLPVPSLPVPSTTPRPPVITVPVPSSLPLGVCLPPLLQLGGC